MVIKNSWVWFCCLCLGFCFCKPKTKTLPEQPVVVQDSLTMQQLIAKATVLSVPQDSCPIHLRFPKTFSLPRTGRLNLYEEADMDCQLNHVLDRKWERYKGKDFDMLVFDEMTDRFSHSHCLAISVLNKKEKKITRFCHLMTGTRGWRYLPSTDGFEGSGVFWGEDLDKDGNPEFLLWDSFYLDDSDILAILFVWVYKADAAGHFKLDKDLTRQFAKRVLAVYTQKLNEVGIEQTAQIMAIFHLNRLINEACVY